MFWLSRPALYSVSPVGGAHADEVGGVAEHVLEVLVTFHLFGIFQLVYLCHIRYQLLVFHNTNHPRLAVSPARCIDARTDDYFQFLMLHRFVEILAYGASRHDVAQHRVDLHLHVGLDGGDLVA